MNEDRRDALSVDDILNEYHAADAAYARRAAPPEPAAAPVRAARPQPAMAQAPQQATPLGAVQAASQPRSSAQKKAPSQTAKKPASKKPVHKKRDYYDDYDEEPRRRGGGALIAVMLLFLLAVGGTCAFGAYAFLCKTVFPGVKVGGVEVGGMSVNEAANLISSSFDEQGTGELTLQMDEYTFNLPVSEVVGGVDANESARAAFRFGREGGPVERAMDIVKARITGADVELTMDVDKKKLTEWLDGIAGESFDGPVQPSYEVVEDQLIVNLGAPGVNFADRSGVESKLLEKLRIMDLEPLSVEATIQDQEAIDLAEVQKAIECEPKSATLDPADGVTVVPGTDGIKMDLEEAKSIIGDATTGEFSIPLELTEAEIDAETLQSLLFRDTLAATETKLNPNEKSRTNNVELACNYINGTILNPGDEFSYNKVVGERTVARGFREAGVFVSGRLEEGMGGGVCQPSSTLYMAVLRADLKVTERSNHGMTVSYTPLGEDATVSWGTLDFRFVNDTEYPVKILASREGSYCKMKILGTNLTGKKVEIKTNTLSKTSWTTVRQLDTSLKPGTERVDQSGSNGYRTETFKVITENGQTTTVKANDSNYRKRDKLVLYNDSSQAAGTDESVLPTDPTKPADQTTTPGDTTTTTPPATPVEPVTPTEPVTPAPQPTTPVEYDPETPMFGPGQPIV